MTQIEFNPEARTTDFTLPDGCWLCDGALAVRLTPGGGAQAVCLRCRVLSHPRVAIQQGKLALAAVPAGVA